MFSLLECRQMPELKRRPTLCHFLPRHLSSFPLLFICQRYNAEFYKQCVRNCLYQNHQVTNLPKEQAYTCISLIKPAQAHAAYTTVQFLSLPHVSAITSPSSRCTTLETYPNTIQLSAGIAQSVQRLATGWMVRGSNPGGGKIFRTSSYWPQGLHSLLYDVYRVFPRSKAAGAYR